MYRKCLIYGPSGSGKTVFVGSSHLDSRTSPHLMMDFEGGSASLDGLVREDGMPIKVVKIETWQQFNEVYASLSEGKNGPGLMYEGVKYKSISIDSISEVHTFALLNLLNDGDKSRKDHPDLVEQRDYGTAMVQLRKLLRSFRDLPMIVFFTATAKTEVEPREGLVRKPALYGQMAEEIVGMFDCCNYLSIVNSTEKNGKEIKEISARVLTLQNTPGLRAKSRSPWKQKIPDSIRIPDLMSENAKNPMTVYLNVLKVPQEELVS